MGSIYKAYDIRGLAQSELNADVAAKVARAVVLHTGARVVVVGRDARESSPRLVQGIFDGLRAVGVRVIDIGLCTTPMFNFAVASDGQVGAGIMVTASHNPAEYNGFKMVAAGARPIPGTVVGELVEQMGRVESSKKHETEDSVATVEQRDVLTLYLDKIFSLSGVQREDLTRVGKIVIDCGNGMVGVALQAFLERAGIDAKVLFGEVDCTFPNHEANPVHEATLTDLKKAVMATGAAFGVAFDGDADRIGFVDERGVRIAGDHIGALLAQELLAHPLGGVSVKGKDAEVAVSEEQAKRLVFGDMNSGKAYAEAVVAAGGEFALVPVGHAHIKKAMRERKALFAAELSYHFYYADFYYVESTLLTLLLVLKRYAREGKRMSELVAPFRTYVASGEKNLSLPKDVVAADVLEKVKAFCEAGSLGKVARVLTEDGLRVEFADAWFCLRASNTEPVVRLNVEAATRERMESLTKVVCLFGNP